MKLFCALAAFCGAVAFATVNPQLQQVKRVYILAMGSGMDQFLASQLTKSGVFEVVTDPKKADAIITDRVGEPFETKLDELYPPPTPPKKVEAAKADDEIDSDHPKSLRQINDDRLSGLDLTGGYRPSTMARGKGNIFIVGRASRSVLWSNYDPPKNNSSGELTKTAARVVKHLKEDLTEKKAEE